MSEHDIKELERQLEAARGKAFAAGVAFKDAQERLNQAKCARKMQEFADQGGVVGVTRVRVSDLFYGNPDMAIGPFLVSGAFVSHKAVRFKLAKIKKDGTASKAGPGAEPTKVFIIAEDQL